MRATSIILSSLVGSLCTASKRTEGVLLSQVKTLTLRDGARTSHRRVSAMPQLSCIGGSAKGLYTVDTMRCKNAGAEYDAEDIQWTCQASLPPEFKLGSTEVMCEGYESPDDPYVLKGSCGVEYRLVLTDLGVEKYGKSAPSWSRGGTQSDGELAGPIATFIFWAIFIGMPLMCHQEPGILTP